jgi:hypothetical protein
MNEVLFHLARLSQAGSAGLEGRLQHGHRPHSTIGNIPPAIYVAISASEKQRAGKLALVEGSASHKRHVGHASKILNPNLKVYLEHHLRKCAVSANSRWGRHSGLKLGTPVSEADLARNASFRAFPRITACLPSSSIQSTISAMAALRAGTISDRRRAPKCRDNCRNSDLAGTGVGAACACSAAASSSLAPSRSPCADSRWRFRSG